MKQISTVSVLKNIWDEPWFSGADKKAASKNQNLYSKTLLP